MKHETTGEYNQETAALYALGALSQHEARSFEAHLIEGCPVCQTELTLFEEVTESLALSQEEVAPPPYLRDVLTARIAREDDKSTGNVTPFEPRISEAPAISQSARSGIGSYILWGLAASLIVAAMASFLAWRQAKAESESLRQELATAQTRSPAEAPRILNLEGQSPAAGSSAKIYWDVEASKWAVTAKLPPPPEGKVYQLWLVKPEAKISAGLIDVDRNGHGFKVVDVPANVSDLDAVAITLEPQGGSSQPTMPIFAVGKVS